MRFATADTPDSIYERDDGCGHDRDAEERMREAAMVIESEGRSAETAEDIEVGGLGGEREYGGGERGLAVQTSAAHVGAE